jgi:hypothetical protein
VRGSQSSRRLFSVLCFSLAMLTLSCSDSTGPAASRNEPGTGTHTMLVDAEIEGQDVSGGFVTQFDVALRDASGNPISGATVRVTNNTLGTINLLEFSAGSGDYQATVNTFAPGDYGLSVVRGTDNVQGVVVGGIAAHRISSPAANATVPASQPMTITWTRPSEAVAADLETQDFQAQGIPDAATYTIPAGNNPARSDQRIRLWRYNEVNIAGGLFGSSLKLSIRNTVEPIVVQ